MDNNRTSYHSVLYPVSGTNGKKHISITLRIKYEDILAAGNLHAVVAHHDGEKHSW